MRHECTVAIGSLLGRHQREFAHLPVCREVNAKFVHKRVRTDDDDGYDRMYVDAGG